MTAKTTHVKVQILWLQVIALAIVQGAISLTWVIYNLYLPALLVQVGLSAALAGGILLLENLLGMVIEPLAGSFADRRQRWLGTSFPFIAIGIISAAALFLLIPLVALMGTSGFGFVLPIALVAWAIAMTAFRSPVLSLLGRYAYGSQLPQAAGVLTLVGGLAGALGPLAQNQIRSLGAPTTFAIGTVVLLVAAWVLRSVRPNTAIAALPTDVDAAVSWLNLAWIFGAGAGVGIGFRFMMQMLPVLLNEQLEPNQVPLIMGGLFVGLAVAALPAGAIAAWLGNRIAMVAGLVIMVALLGAVPHLSQGWLLGAIAISLGASFSLVANGTIPFALMLVPPVKAGLGTGMYFSGGAAAASLSGVVAAELSTRAGISMAMLGFAIAAVCVVTAPRSRSLEVSPSLP